MLEIGEVRTAASALGIEIVPLDIQRAEDIAGAFDAFSARAEALYVSTDPLIFTEHRVGSIRLHWALDCRRFTTARST